MRRCSSLLLAVLMVLTLCTGCGSRKDEPERTPKPTAETVQTPDFDPADVTPAMWKVTDDAGHTLYLFGTIHVGDGRSDTALEKILPTVDSCDALALEFDLMEYEQDMQAQMQTVLTFALTDGSKVTDQMPDELFARAKDLLDEAGVYNDMLQSYNVQFWSTLVDQGVMMTRSDLSPDYAMDSKLCAHAYDTDLPVYSVESAQEQYDLLNSVPDELAVAMIEDTLDSMDTYNDDLSEMYALWLSGATDELLAFIEADEEPDPEEYPPELITMAEDFNRAMGPDRNEGMSKKALEYLASGKTVFFAVGAAHMLGEEGLVQLLTEAGCTVERYDYAA